MQTEKVELHGTTLNTLKSWEITDGRVEQAWRRGGRPGIQAVSHPFFALKRRYRPRIPPTGGGRLQPEGDDEGDSERRRSAKRAPALPLMAGRTITLTKVS
ncbi:hypothetical protein CGMCC3_g2550 [Colletotrichum fructicola]|nr:uncharacterized protein CGMCC3_g2550 [Colletotrichum fructicola]KAE9581475.1 hypothetical protein CGMCC3_g2550 [Colletotrichum fructicola]